MKYVSGKKRGEEKQQGEGKENKERENDTLDVVR